MTVKKRFVAGAVCPRCAKMDKLVVYQLEGSTVRECVACGYKDTQQDDIAQVQAGANLPTRVNKQESNEGQKSDEVQEVAIRFYPNTKMN